MKLFEQFILAEGAKDNFIRKCITNGVRNDFKLYLKTPLTELPEEVLKTIQGDNAELVDKVSNDPTMNRLIDFYRLYLLKYFDINRGNGPVEYLNGITRIACGELQMFGQMPNTSALAQFKILVLFLHTTGEECNLQFDKDLNGMTYNDFRKVVQKARKEYDATHKHTFEGAVSDAYDIVPIADAQQAEQYGKYTSWCVTHGSFDGYASYKSGNRFYFCLKKGFENVQPSEADADKRPFDEYGLSMISVLVDFEGEPRYITTRWNHQYDGENNESLHTKEQVEAVIGRPFDETFPPYSREELHERGIVFFDEVEELLAQGASPKDVFDALGCFLNGFTKVKLNDKWNLLNTKGQLLSPNQWFDDCGYFIEGLAWVELNGKMNHIDTDGQLLSPNMWFDYCDSFNEGLGRIRLNDKWNFLTTDGQIAFPNQWFDWSGDFCEGLVLVELNGKFNWISTDGQLLSPNQWFDNCDDRGDFVDGLAWVQLNGKYNFISTDGKLVSPNQWFDDCKLFRCGLAMVKFNGVWHEIDTKGNIVEGIRHNVDTIINEAIMRFLRKNIL